MDGIEGVLIAYEMREEWDKPSREKEAFKSFKNKEAHQTSDSSKEYSDEKEVNFLLKLKKSFGKYKVKFPFKFFDCGRIWHLSSKFPSTNKNKNKEEYEHKNNKNQYDSSKGKGKKHYKHKINMYALDEGISSNEHDSDFEEVLFLSMLSKDDPSEDEKK